MPTPALLATTLLFGGTLLYRFVAGTADVVPAQRG